MFVKVRLKYRHRQMECSLIHAHNESLEPRRFKTWIPQEMFYPVRLRDRGWQHGAVTYDV